MSETASALQSLFPPLILIVYITCVAGAGALANCAVLASLFKQAKYGLHSIIIQLAAADFILMTTIGPELWFLNSRTWQLGNSACISYKGLNVFASTASLYLVITIALHTLATVNLEEKEAIRQKRKQSDDEELRSSRHSLVNSDSSTPPRTMNVDYSFSNTRVPVTPPITFVWVLAASLSVPAFTLTTTIPLENKTVLCTLSDDTHRYNMHNMLAAFNFIFPSIFLIMAVVLVVLKLKKPLIADNGELTAALKLSLGLIITYALLCVPRSLIKLYHTYSLPDKKSDPFVTDEFNIFPIVTLISSCAFILSTLIRPILCILLLPSVRNALSSRKRIVNV